MMAESMDLQGLGLSTEGLATLKENGVTLEILKKFTENDIQDVFKNLFMDRFKVRQFINGQHNPDSFTRNPDQDQLVKPSKPHDSAKKSQDPASKPQDTVTHHFEVREMLSTKEVRGKPTEAQSYFAALIRDAASSARIWKKAYKISDIPQRKKESFLQAVVERCPNLQGYEKEVWNKLKMAIHNRRKYLHDLETGKRRSTQKEKKGAGPRSTDHDQMERQTENMSMFSSGDPLLMCGKSGAKVGKGIFLRKMNDIYSEIVVKTVDQPDERDMDDFELAAQAEGKNYLCNALIKKKITWKTERLLKEKSGSKLPLLKEKSVAAGTSDSGLVQTKNATASSACGSGLSKEKGASVPTKKRTFEEPPNNSKEKQNSAKMQKLTFKTVEATKSCPATCTVSEEVDEPSLCVYEWSQGQCFIGVQYISQKRIIKVINCMKPVASIGDSVTIHDIERNAKIYQPNAGDIQKDPDFAFRVCMLSNNYLRASIKKIGKKSVVEVKLDSQKNVDGFKSKLRAAIEKYMDE